MKTNKLNENKALAAMRETNNGAPKLRQNDRMAITEKHSTTYTKEEFNEGTIRPAEHTNQPTASANPPRRIGRPQSQIDERRVSDLARKGLTQAEIAASVGVHIGTLEKRLAEDAALRAAYDAARADDVEECINVMHDLMCSPTTPAPTRLRAAEWILTRHHGRTSELAAKPESSISTPAKFEICFVESGTFLKPNEDEAL